MRTSIVLSAVLLGATVAHAHAHEYVAKPLAMHAQPGQEIALEVVSSHVFLRSVELEDPNDSRAGLWVDGKRTPVALRADEQAMVYRATVTAPGEGCFLITGERAAQIWATTPQGGRRVGREAPGATNVRLIEKFSKAVINATAGDTGCLRPIGDRLEIVTLTNPADVKPGQEMTVQVLYNGKPLTVSVYATYDGFSGEENTYAYYTEGRPDGTARIKITQPGLWMIRAEQATADRTADHDRYVGRAVLLVEVK